MPVKFIVLGLIQGINALEIVLVPCVSSSTCSTNSVLIPVLLKSDLVVSILLVIKLRPCLTFSVFVDTTPDHCVSHEFQIVPSLFSFAAKTAS